MKLTKNNFPSLRGFKPATFGWLEIWINLFIDLFKLLQYQNVTCEQKKWGITKNVEMTEMSVEICNIKSSKTCVLSFQIFVYGVYLRISIIFRFRRYQYLLCKNKVGNISHSHTQRMVLQVFKLMLNKVIFKKYN